MSYHVLFTAILVEMDPLLITLIDDDASFCEMVKDHITKKFPTAQIVAHATGEEALDATLQKPDIIVLDYSLDSIKADAMNGIQVFTKFKDRYPDTPVIFLSSQDRMDVATNTIKYGAYDYITKNETAFHRLELDITNLTEHGKLKKSHGTQKLMNKIFWGLVLIYIIYMIYLQITS